MGEAVDLYEAPLNLLWIVKLGERKGVDRGGPGVVDRALNRDVEATVAASNLWGEGDRNRVPNLASVGEFFV